MNEDQIKAEFKARMWWLHFPTMWKTLGTILNATREVNYWQSEIDKVRSRYVRRGRKAKAA